MRTGTLFGLATLLIGGLIWDVQHQLNTPSVLQKSITFDIPPGSGFSSVRERLRSQGVLNPRSAFYLTFWTIGTGSGSRVRAGEYRLTPEQTPLQVMQLLLSGKTFQHQLTLIEGWSFQQALKAVMSHPALKITLKGKSPAEIMAAVGEPRQHPEGRFLPETYRFTKGTTDLAFLKRANRAMQIVLDETWKVRQDDLPYKTPDQALVMASIVERETSAEEERAVIAGVFVRRLRIGMRLQTDPTVIYGLGATFDGNLRRRDLRRDTPYNTYTRKGLPPTPICLPGRDSLQAAMHPADGDSLYFVSRGDGTHQFSATLDQHTAAVRRYQLKR